MGNSFVAIDFEISNPSRFSLCSVGIVHFLQGIPYHRYYKLVQPPSNEFSDIHTSIHGLCAEMMNNIPPFPIVWKDISHFFDNNLIIAHNASFDIDVLKQTLSYYSLPMPRFDYICTYELFNDTLQNLSIKYGIPLMHHDALSDAETCGKLYIEYLKQNKGFTPIEANVSFVPESKRHEPFRGGVLKPDFDAVVNKNNYFFKKKVVITGIFNNYDRKKLASDLRKLGADINTSVSKHTNILIAGKDPGPSKIKMMTQLINSGYDAELIDELMLQSILESKK